MRVGTVNDRHQAIITLGVRSASGADVMFEAGVDTGFTGWLALPETIVRELGLECRRRDAVILANGEVLNIAACRAVVQIGSILQDVPVFVMGQHPLAGSQLLHGYRLCVAMTPGGPVTLTRMRRRTQGSNHWSSASFHGLS